MKRKRQRENDIQREGDRDMGSVGRQSKKTKKEVDKKQGK